MKFYIHLIILLFASSIQKEIKLGDIFLGLDLSDSIFQHYEHVEKDKSFQIPTEYTEEVLLESAEFRATYLETNEVYPFADSLEISVITCGAIPKYLEKDDRRCVEVVIIYYLDSAKSIDEEYERINELTNDAILLTDNKWKNHPGATKGAYFLTEDLSPVITIDKHTFRKNYITVSHYLEMK